MTDKRWLVIDKRGGAYGTVRASQWFLAREAAQRDFKTAPEFLVVTPVEDSSLTRVLTDAQLFRVMGVSPRVRHIELSDPVKVVLKKRKKSRGFVAAARKRVARKKKCR